MNNALRVNEFHCIGAHDRQVKEDLECLWVLSLVLEILLEISSAVLRSKKKIGGV
jgi:hypothetical protein